VFFCLFFWRDTALAVSLFIFFIEEEMGMRQMMIIALTYKKGELEGG
jgi:hypothetical protein